MDSNFVHHLGDLWLEHSLHGRAKKYVSKYGTTLKHITQPLILSDPWEIGRYGNTTENISPSILSKLPTWTLKRLTYLEAIHTESCVLERFAALVPKRLGLANFFQAWQLISSRWKDSLWFLVIENSFYPLERRPLPKKEWKHWWSKFLFLILWIPVL